ncbi:DltD N-terminal domain protein [Tricladium varicosporioides]|nr:DltD N-terminal domain protein [Hymenoscyphus varicosporioides]
MPRKDIEFKNGVDVTLRGWLYTPTGTVEGGAPLPCLVMVHGFSAVKEMTLDQYAEIFVTGLNLAVLIYDNRGYGASDTVLGQPRNEIVPADQISDLQDAITYAQSLPGVDGSKIGIWGSSYGAGHCLVVAATDKRVKAVIAQAPFVDGPTTFSRLVRSDIVPMLEAGFEQERQARAAGHPAATMSITDANPMAQCALPTPDTFAFFDEWSKKTTWQNEVTVRTMELMRGYAPHNYMELISPRPLLMVIQNRDVLCGPDLSLKAYAKALEPKELLLMEGGHFDTYKSPNLEISAKRQVEFLRSNICA